MICQNCKKEVNQPLELYDGGWACPNCRHDLVISSDNLQFTSENEELYVLADRCYYTYLTAVNSQNNTQEQREHCRELLNRAIELTRQSAYRGNPRAIVRLGYYYDKDYVEVNRTEVERCRMAYLLYATVWMSNKKSDKLMIEAGEWEEIKRNAARLTMEMLANAPEELVSQERYRVEANKNAIMNILNYKVNVRAVDKRANINVSRTAFEIFCSFRDKERAPLFGFIRLTPDELKSALSTVDMRGNVQRTGEDYVTKSERGHEVMLFAQPTAGGKLTSRFTKLTNARLINEMLNGQFKNAEELFIYFVNEQGGHRYLKNRHINAVQKCLARDSYHRVRRLCDTKMSSMVFYDDDLYLCMAKKLSVSGALDALLEKVVEKR